MDYNFETESNIIKLLMQYEDATQKVVFGNIVLASFLSGVKFDVMPRNGDCSGETIVLISVFRNQVLYQKAASLQN
jgi:hypothetical protein